MSSADTSSNDILTNRTSPVKWILSLALECRRHHRCLSGQRGQVLLADVLGAMDRQGVIRAAYHGPMPRSIIAGTVEQLLREGK